MFGGLWLAPCLCMLVINEFRPEIEEPITAEVIRGGRAAIVRWETNHPARAWVEFGTGEFLSPTSDFPPQSTTRHEQTISPLAPGEEFTFQVFAEFDHPSGGHVVRESRRFVGRAIEGLETAKFFVDHTRRIGPVRHIFDAISDDQTSDPVKRSFYREQRHLIRARRLFTPLGDTTPGWDPEVRVEDRVFRFDNSGNPIYNWGRVDDLFDESVSQFDHNFVTITGMPLGLSANKVTTGSVTVREGERDVYGVGTNFTPEMIDEVFCIHFGNENGGDNGDPWNRWSWVTEVVSPTHLRIQWPYQGTTKEDIGYVIIRSNAVQSNRSTTWDHGHWRELIRRFFLRLVERYGADRVRNHMTFSFWNEPDVHCGVSEWFRDSVTGCTDWVAFRELYATTRQGMEAAFSELSLSPPPLGFASFGSQKTEETETILQQSGTRADLLSFHYYGHNNFFHHIDLDGMQWQWDWGAPAWGEIFSRYGSNWYEMEKHLTEIGPSIDWEHMSHHLGEYGAGFMGFLYTNILRVSDVDPGKVFERAYLHADHIGNFVRGFGYFDAPRFYDGNTDVYIKRPMFNAVEMMTKMTGERVETRRVGLNGDPFLFATASTHDSIGLDNIFVGHWKSDGWVNADDGNHNTLENDDPLQVRYPIEIASDPTGIIRTKVYTLPSQNAYRYWRDQFHRQGDPVYDDAPLTSEQIETLLSMDSLEVQSFDGHQRFFDVPPQQVKLIQYLRQPNLRPSAVMGWGPSTDEPGALRFFATQSLDRDGVIREYHWDFGDGTIAQGRSVTHRFPAEGGYTVRLVVVDDDGTANNTTDYVWVGP